MTYRRKLPPLDPCPVEAVLSIVAGKWKVRVLYLLSLQALTFGELRKSIAGVRQQVLANLLQELETHAVISRSKLAAADGTRYALTAKGLELVELLKPLAQWGNGLLAEQGLAWQAPIVEGDAGEMRV